MKRLLLVAGLFLLAGLVGTSAAQERPGPQHSAPERPAPPSPPPASAPPPPSSMGAPPPSGGSSGAGGGSYAVPRNPGAARYGGDDGRVRTPKSDAGMTSGSAGEDQSGRRRVPAAGSGSGGTDQSGRRRVPVAGGPGGSGGSGSGGAVDRYSRPRGGRPTTGVAVPRQGGIYRPGYGYNYPSWREYYPYYGIGAWGVGMWYYDPWFWDPYGYGYGYGYGSGYGYGGYGGGYGGYYRVSYDDTGSVRLKVKPRNAQVFVDGYYVGIVDEYDGTFQRLRVERGPHRIEVRLEGFETLEFDLRVLLDHTITLHGELKPAPQ